MPVRSIVDTELDVAGEIAAHLEGVRLCVADSAKHFLVGVVPSVDPLRLPVVFGVVLENVVPYHFQVEVDGRYLHIDVGAALVEMELRLTHASRCDKA